MRVHFTDPQGPKKWRVLPYLPPLGAVLLAMFAMHGAPAWIVGLLGLATINLLGIIPSLRQRKSRDVELVMHPGAIEIRGAGTRNQTIRTKDLVGATTSRTSAGILLTFAHARRDQPVTIRVESDADASAIRQALGIGHGGFGVVGWRSLPTDGRKSAVVGRAFAFVVAAACAVLTLIGATELAGILGAIFGLFAVIGMIIGLSDLASQANDPSIVMTADGLRLRTLRGWFALPYDGVLDIHDHGRGVVFTVPPPYHTVGVECSGPAYGGVSPHDREVMSAQILAASQRARGLGPQKNDVTGRVEVLRRNGESPRDWLMRLDMQGRLLSTSPGYRGNTLDTEDLWAVLEDPEAEPELRAAAARVLRHAPQPDARARIDAAVAAVREDDVNRRLRIAVSDDVDAASQELATLEAQAMQAQYLRRMFPGR